MNILLATGIYPPEIGGPATYVHALAKELTTMGMQVTVVTYGKHREMEDASWKVYFVPKTGGPFSRWKRYASALKKNAKDCDVVYAFSSVSCGVPLLFSGIRTKKKVLRLGGDFFWERYTDRGGKKSLREWYAWRPLSRFVIKIILAQFTHIVFSTEFQQKLYKKYYALLPRSSVIENALPQTWNPHLHHNQTPFRLLVMSRLVHFKNIDSLIKAMALLPKDILLTIVGDGPRKNQLQSLVYKHHAEGRVAFVSPLHGKEKRHLFTIHELLVVPSLTDISPNAALEASSTGLPVLMTQETGLSKTLTKGMVLAELRTVEQIANAILSVRENYPTNNPLSHKERSWAQVAKEHISLFSSLS